MADFVQFGGPPRSRLMKQSSTGLTYIDYRNIEDLRRLMTPNGKIQSRKRTQLNAHDQRMAAHAIKRARYMGLLPYTSATL